MRNLAMCLGGLMLWAPLTHAAVIATVDFAHTYNLPLTIGGAPSSTIYVNFSYTLSPGGFDDPATTVFDSLTLGAGDGGRTFTVTAADDPQFAAFVANATDGQDDDLRFLVLGNGGGGGGSLAPESFLINALVPVTGADLAGYSIDGLELFIEELFINPLAATGELNWMVRGELRFLSSDVASVPLPGGLLMFVSALLGTAVRYRGAGAA